jgi:P27 family predicted phage terminase small subunit
MANKHNKEYPKEYDQPPPPDHLSAEMKLFWETIFAKQRLQIHHIPLFQKAVESYDRAEAARKIIEAEGMTFKDRFGQPRARPEANIEAVARAQFHKLISDCGLFDSFFIRDRGPNAEWTKY